MGEPLVRRPVWRDRLSWIWLLSLPVAYAAIFAFAERTQGLPAGSGAEWARTTAICLALWSVAVTGGGVWLRRALRRTETRLVRLLVGGDGADARGT